MPDTKDMGQHKWAQQKTPYGEGVKNAIPKSTQATTPKTRDAVAHQIRVGLLVVPFSLFILIIYPFRTQFRNSSYAFVSVPPPRTSASPGCPFQGTK